MLSIWEEDKKLNEPRDLEINYRDGFLNAEANIGSVVQHKQARVELHCRSSNMD